MIACHTGHGIQRWSGVGLSGNGHRDRSTLRINHVVASNHGINKIGPGQTSDEVDSELQRTAVQGNNFHIACSHRTQAFDRGANIRSSRYRIGETARQGNRNRGGFVGCSRTIS